MRRDQPAIRLGGPPRHGQPAIRHKTREGNADFILGAIAVSAFGHLGAEKPSSHATSGRAPAA